MSSTLKCQPKIWATVALLSVLACLAWGLPTAQNQDGPQKPSIRGASCFDSYGRPYMEDIANPGTCAGFYKCTITNASEPYRPEPIPQWCPANLGLCFDIYTCRCEYCDLGAVCFDPENPVHNTDEVRFHCATLLERPPGQLSS